ncbi:hypothetical protein O9992_21880 [Vibrio lentus]|nr:hypothetical protein [Vibrio lentus]
MPLTVTLLDGTLESGDQEQWRNWWCDYWSEGTKTVSKQLWTLTRQKQLNYYPLMSKSPCYCILSKPVVTLSMTMLVSSIAELKKILLLMGQRHRHTAMYIIIAIEVDELSGTILIRLLPINW